MTSAVAITPRAGFTATLASEWTKLTTVRSTVVVAGLTVVLAVAIAALAAVGTGATYDDWSAVDKADFDPTLYPLIGGIVVAILLPVLGVRAVTSEYSTGMIRLTHGHAAAGACRAGQGGRRCRGRSRDCSDRARRHVPCSALVYREYGLDTSSFFDAGAVRAVAVTSSLAPVFPLIAVALAVILRSTAAAIATVLAFVFVPGILGEFLPGWWQEHVLAYLPGSATDSLAISHLTETELGPVAAVLVLAGWVAAFVAAACVVIARRDA